MESKVDIEAILNYIEQLSAILKELENTSINRESYLNSTWVYKKARDGMGILKKLETVFGESSENKTIELPSERRPDIRKNEDSQIMLDRNIKLSVQKQVKAQFQLELKEYEKNHVGSLSNKELTEKVKNVVDQEIEKLKTELCTEIFSCIDKQIDSKMNEKLQGVISNVQVFRFDKNDYDTKVETQEKGRNDLQSDLEIQAVKPQIQVQNSKPATKQLVKIDANLIRQVVTEFEANGYYSDSHKMRLRLDSLSAQYCIDAGVEDFVRVTDIQRVFLQETTGNCQYDYKFIENKSPWCFVAPWIKSGRTLVPLNVKRINQWGFPLFFDIPDEVLNKTTFKLRMEKPAIFKKEDENFYLVKRGKLSLVE